LVSALSCAKTAEQIKTPFGMWTQVGPWNHVLDPPSGGTVFLGGEGAFPSPL